MATGRQTTHVLLSSRLVINVWTADKKFFIAMIHIKRVILFSSATADPESQIEIAQEGKKNGLCSVQIMHKQVLPEQSEEADHSQSSDQRKGELLQE
ncbi:MAG: hypothetical protein V4628_13920 [Pseudomonadota bacterium]